MTLVFTRQCWKITQKPLGACCEIWATESMSKKQTLCPWTREIKWMLNASWVKYNATSSSLLCWELCVCTPWLKKVYIFLIDRLQKGHCSMIYKYICKDDTAYIIYQTVHIVRVQICLPSPRKKKKLSQNDNH